MSKPDEKSLLALSKRLLDLASQAPSSIQGSLQDEAKQLIENVLEMMTPAPTPAAVPSSRKQSKPSPRNFDFRVNGDHAEICLTQGKIAIIDLADLDLVKGIRWHAYKAHTGIFYARTNVKTPTGKRGIVDLQRFLTKPAADQHVKFLDGNSLNCRRSNLLVRKNVTCSGGQP